MNLAVSFSLSNEECIAKYQAANIPLQIREGVINNWPYQYLGITADSATLKPILLFVHGAPGAADMFEPFLMDSNLHQDATLIAVDRLGYGHSFHGRSAPTFKEQVEQLHDLLSHYLDRKVIAIGHSYGGPIITRLAIDYPDDVQALLLLAPAHDPALEQYEGIANVARWRATRWLFADLWQVSADEKYVHVRELEKIKDQLIDIQIPITHVHGKKDILVPYGNLNFSQSHFDPKWLKSVSLDDAGHLLLEKENVPAVMKEIRWLMDKIKTY